MVSFWRKKTSVTYLPVLDMFSPKLPRQTTSGNIFQSGPCFAQMYFPHDLISQQEDSFVVGTAEGTVFHFQLVSVTSNSSEKQWVRTKPFQHHTHDVRTVAHSPTALISGGGLCFQPGYFTLPSSDSFHAGLFLILMPSPCPLPFPGTDTHLVIRPLMEKVEVKNYDAALRKITFPHVSITS